MNYQHGDLARGRWHSFSLIEQMAHIGSEVERALAWRRKNNTEYSRKAFERSLALIDLTLESVRRKSSIREITRLREVLVDYFLGSNQCDSCESSWQKYFMCFTYAARKNF